MSNSSSSTPSRTLYVFLGTLAAFASFAVIAAVLQAVAGGPANDPRSADRLKIKEDIAKEQDALITKYGLKGDASAVFAKAEAQIKTRKVAATAQVVPGSPTALKAAVAPPAASPGAAVPTPAPVIPAPVAPAPAAVTPPPAAAPTTPGKAPQ